MSCRPRIRRDVRSERPRLVNGARPRRITTVERLPLNLRQRWQVRLELLWHRYLETRARHRVRNVQREIEREQRRD